MTPEYIKGRENSCCVVPWILVLVFYSVRFLGWFTSYFQVCLWVMLKIEILFSFFYSTNTIFSSCRDRDSRQNGRNGEDLVRLGHRDRSYSGPLTPTTDRSNGDYRVVNGNQGGSRRTSGMPLKSSI